MNDLRKVQLEIIVVSNDEMAEGLKQQGYDVKVPDMDWAGSNKIACLKSSQVNALGFQNNLYEIVDEILGEIDGYYDRVDSTENGLGIYPLHLESINKRIKVAFIDRYQ